MKKVFNVYSEELGFIAQFLNIYEANDFVDEKNAQGDDDYYFVVETTEPWEKSDRRSYPIFIFSYFFLI